MAEPIKIGTNRPYAKKMASVAPFCALILSATLMVGCNEGISPPTEDRLGTISGTISYSMPWPPPDEFVEIRFVALRFVPQDTADFLQLNRMVFSDPLTYGVAADTFTISNVPVGFFPYSGVARQATSDVFSWGPIGLFAGGDGVFSVDEAETTRVHVDVDFSNPPDFP